MHHHLLSLVVIIGVVHAKVQAQCNTAFTLGNDTTLCPGQSLVLNAGSGYLTYQWSTGASGPSITVNAPGTYSVQVQAFDQGNDLVINGNFSAGGTGFTSDYVIGPGGPWGPLSIEGSYLVSNNPTATHSAFSPCGDHTTGTGNMLVVNGAAVTNTNVWCQTVNVQPGTDYAFSAWLTSVFPQSPATLQFSINGVPVGSQLQAAPGTCNWNQFYSLWNSGTATVATLCITNQNTSVSGNDFALDDISFTPFCTYTSSITVEYAPFPEPDLGPDIAICTNDAVVLDAFLPGGTYLWQDGSTATTFPATDPGTYWVDVTVNGCTARDSVLVGILPQPVVDLGPDLSLCEGTIHLLSAQQQGASYAWQDGSLSPTYPVSVPGIYWVTVDLQGCLASDTVEVAYRPLPDVFLGPDTTICADTPLALSAEQPGATYLWHDGTTAPTNTASQPGILWVEVTLDGCSLRDSIAVATILLPEVDLGPDVDLCEGQYLILSARGDGYGYLWNDGAQGPEYLVPGAGTYAVTVYNSCGDAYDELVVFADPCDCPVYVPNAFTPDGDGRNDGFKPLFDCAMAFYHLQVFDRWGALVFETKDPDRSWRGGHMDSDTPLKDGVYAWTLEVRSATVNDNKRRRTSGHVVLLR